MRWLLAVVVAAALPLEKQQPFLGGKKSWDEVCGDEAARSSKFLYKYSSRRDVAAVQNALVLAVQGGQGVPLSVLEGSTAVASYVGDAAVALNLDAAARCEDAKGSKATAKLVARPNENLCAPDLPADELRKLSRYQCQAPRLVALHAVACVGGRVVAAANATTSVVARHRSECGADVPALPPANDPTPVLGLLRRTADADALRDARFRLAHLLETRGVLCDRVDPDDPTACSVREVACPAKCKKNEGCLYSQSSGATPHCIEVCISTTAIRHSWRADISKKSRLKDFPDRCQVAQIHGLASWWDAHRNATPFDPELSTLLSDVTEPQSLGRCAVVGSGHALRCASWGPVLDSAAYDAVFRINHVALMPTVMTEHTCRVATRTDFAVNYLPKPNHTETVVLRSRRGRPVLKTSEKLNRTLEQGIPLLLPSDEVLRRGPGGGSGTAALGLAFSLCRNVDFYGFGLYRSLQSGGNDFRYLHYYQQTPNADEAVSGGVSVLISELRNALLHAYGLANFVWWRQ
ncbi:hypothetical protein CTAYLR_004974 [Chrysophaeum taylorii]|uniref:Uncharacterized protein n=1 Tax=Chrysophaeum taylorii TaxID=2483200 RepID=A0AAD7XUZ8_9STRA|nr:hypothetical protein CTAYLR_004974 [Chrysophaeum taylorii]